MPWRLQLDVDVPVDDVLARLRAEVGPGGLLMGAVTGPAFELGLPQPRGREPVLFRGAVTPRGAGARIEATLVLPLFVWVGVPIAGVAAAAGIASTVVTWKLWSVCALAVIGLLWPFVFTWHAVGVRRRLHTIAVEFPTP